MSVLVLLAVLGLGFVGLRPLLRDAVIGNHLARLTTLVEVGEERERTARELQGAEASEVVGAAMLAQFQQGLAHLSRYPRHEVTKALLKNALLAGKLGREARVAAIYRLLDLLVEHQVALGVREFKLSYQ